MDAIGVDVGGTSIVGSVVNQNGSFSQVLRVPTPRSGARDVCAKAAQMIRKLREASDSLPVAGVCLPGIVDAESGVGIASANLGWQDAPLRDMLEEFSGIPVQICQDVRSGAVAEARWGVQLPSFYYLALGTGLAAATIVNYGPAEIDPRAGEIGQFEVPSPYGPGTVRLEKIVSGPGLARLAQQRGTLPPKGTSRDLVELAKSDNSARSVLDEAMATLADVLAPGMFLSGALPVVLGGGPSRGGNLLTAPLARALEERLHPFLPAVPVLTARLDDKSQMLGAAALAFDTYRAERG